MKLKTLAWKLVESINTFQFSRFHFHNTFLKVIAQRNEGVTETLIFTMLNFCPISSQSLYLVCKFSLHSTQDKQYRKKKERAKMALLEEPFGCPPGLSITQLSMRKKLLAYQKMLNDHGPY